MEELGAVLALHAQDIRTTVVVLAMATAANDVEHSQITRNIETLDP
jgi:hypothetical protein